MKEVRFTSLGAGRATGVNVGTACEVLGLSTELDVAEAMGRVVAGEELIRRFALNLNAGKARRSAARSSIVPGRVSQ